MRGRRLLRARGGERTDGPANSELLMPDMNLKRMMESYERQLIESALEASSGNQRRAAAALGVLPTTLHEKMKRLGLIRRALDDSQVGAA